MIVTGDRLIQLNIGSAKHTVRSADDPMMIIKTKIYKSETIGVILMRMGRKG